MKQKMIVLTISVLFCYCAGNEKRPEIDGTYVNHSEGEFSMADDTLIISNLNDKSYSVIRKTGFQKIREGKLLPKEQRQEDLTAVYDPQTSQLQESKRGRIITLHEDNKVIRLEAVEYNRLQ